ncbi:MAG: RsmD family RNA methyltransferase [Candidatus Methanomethylophilaceae archaeon]|nr:RsmD family RNA methyltransferase [Candidatus Methanomethylophilaceae archaeon]
MSPSPFFFELSGEHGSLCSAEALGCLRAEAPGFRALSSGPGYFIASFEENAVEPIADRISLTRHIGRHLGSFSPNDLSGLGSIRIPEGTFSVRCRRFEGMMRDIDSQDLVRKLGKELSVSNDVRLKDPDIEVRVLMSDMIHVFLSERTVDRESLENRKVSERPFFSPISLHLKYARALINLTGARKGDLLLDPFCGTGGIVIEAASMGIRAAASDFDSEMIAGTRENMDFFNLDLEDSDVLDISEIGPRFGPVDVIATDPPYGRSTKTGGEKIDSIYARAMRSFSEVLRPGGTAGVVLPHELDPSPLKMDGLHVQRVHGSLSRYYHVLRN